MASDDSITNPCLLPAEVWASAAVSFEGWKQNSTAAEKKAKLDLFVSLITEVTAYIKQYRQDEPIDGTGLKKSAYEDDLDVFVAALSQLVEKQFLSVFSTLNETQSSHAGTSDQHAAVNQAEVTLNQENIARHLALVEHFCQSIIEHDAITELLDSIKILGSMTSYGGILGSVDIKANKNKVNKKQQLLKTVTLIYTAETYIRFLIATQYSGESSKFDSMVYQQSSPVLDFSHKDLSSDNPYLLRFKTLALKIAESGAVQQKLRIKYYLLLVNIEFSKGEKTYGYNHLREAAELLRNELAGLEAQKPSEKIVQRIAEIHEEKAIIYKTLKLDFYRYYNATWSKEETETYLSFIRVNFGTEDDASLKSTPSINQIIEYADDPNKETGSISSDRSDGSNSSQRSEDMRGVRALLQADKVDVLALIRKIFQTEKGSYFRACRQEIAEGSDRQAALMALIDVGLLTVDNYNLLMSVDDNAIRSFRKALEKLKKEKLVTQTHYELLVYNSELNMQGDAVKKTDNFCPMLIAETLIEVKTRLATAFSANTTSSSLVELQSSQFRDLPTEISKLLTDCNEQLDPQYQLNQTHLLNMIFMEIYHREVLDSGDATRLLEQSKDIKAAIMTVAILRAQEDTESLTPENIKSKFIECQRLVYLNDFMTEVTTHLGGRSESSRKYKIMNDLTEYMRNHAEELSSEPGSLKKLVLHVIQAALMHRHKVKEQETTSAHEVIEFLNKPEYSQIKLFLGLKDKKVTQSELKALIAKELGEDSMFGKKMRRAALNLYGLWDVDKGKAVHVLSEGEIEQKIGRTPTATLG